MPDPMKKPDEQNRLTADDVIGWLKEHPDFFRNYPEALDALDPDKPQQDKGIADFHYYMVKRLRADRDSVMKSAREIVETTRANMSNQARINMAVLMLLEARGFDEFIRTLTMDIAPILDIDIISLIIETEGNVIPHIDLAGVRAVGTGTVDLFTKERPVVLESGVRGYEELYGGGAGLVKSQALLRLGFVPGGPPALIAFGSRNPDMFREGQGTELVIFLGRVVERCFRLWLDIPPL